MLRSVLVTVTTLLLVLHGLGLPQVEADTGGSFSESIRVSVPDLLRLEQRDPALAVTPDGTILVVWQEFNHHGIPGVQISRSLDGGATFSNASTLAPGIAEQEGPRIAVTANGTVVVWTEFRGDRLQIMVSRSYDLGISFSPAVELAPSTSAQRYPDIAADGDLVVVAWAQNDTGHFDIMVAASSDQGASFGPPVRVDQGEGEPSLYPSLAVRGHEVFVAWQDAVLDPFLDIMGAWSNDSGGNFSSPVAVSDGPTGHRQSQPDAAFLPDGNLTVVWRDERTGDFDIRCSVSSGRTFAPSVTVGLQDGHQDQPSVVADPLGRISVAYLDEASGAPHVTLSLSRDGNSFSSGVRVDELGETSVQGAPALCLLNGTPVVVFEGWDGDDWDIFFSVMLNSPPSVTITSPSQGEVVTGTTVIEGNATDPDDNDTLLRVEVRISGQDLDTGWIEASGGGNWSLEFDTTQLLNGGYLVEARSFDGRAHSALAVVEVEVGNEVQMHPDLAFVGNITVLPLKLQRGEPILVRVNVTNLGNATATNVQVRFSRGTVQIGEEVIPRLTPGGTALSFTYWMALEGLHTLRVTLDPDQVIPEIDENNNALNQQVRVMPEGYYRPDLNLTGELEVDPSDLVDGDQTVVTAQVMNSGRADASSILVTLTLDGEEVANRTLDMVRVNQSVQVEFEWAAVPGQHQLEVEVDPRNTTSELREDNNRVSVSVEVGRVEAFPGWYAILGLVSVVIGAVAVVAIIRMRRR